VWFAGQVTRYEESAASEPNTADGAAKKRKRIVLMKYYKIDTASSRWHSFKFVVDNYER
jgi:hypothetical protein